MSHANARFDSRGRLLLVQKVAAGEPQAEATRQVRLSRGTMAKWWGRWVEHGDTGLVDRSSRPRRRTDAGTEERIFLVGGVRELIRLACLQPAGSTAKQLEARRRPNGSEGQTVGSAANKTVPLGGDSQK